ncbi:hypothetical protein [Serratia marcescens]|uniref:hypothetical protein n=1 Tax=Serratia marcescens TaxID=615 RepID=UPI0013D91E89|nr:hypothetical protein [Serratia marcescens]
MGKAPLLMLIVALSACSLLKTNLNNISELSNDELCRATGEYQDNGSVVLKLHDEIMRREDMNFERCYAIEKSSIPGDFSIEPTVEPKKLEHVFDPESKRYKTIETGGGAGAKIKW